MAFCDEFFGVVDFYAKRVSMYNITAVSIVVHIQIGPVSGFPLRRRHYVASDC